ncbi:hypothetical protein D3C75_666790 [compost metagenome]
MEDIWSGEQYRMPYCETMVKLPPWSVAIGMVEPYFEHWCIHGAFMWCGPDIKQAVMTQVQQLQAEASQASGRELSPADIIAGHYPDMINICYSINTGDEKDVKSPKDTQEQSYITRTYTCNNTELLAEMLLKIEAEYLLAPGTDPAEEKIVISRAEKLDGILDALPADRKAQLGLDDIHIVNSLGNIEMDAKEVTVSGWWSSELEATLELLESKTSTIGLSLVNEHREAHQFPKGVILKEATILTEKDLSEQEIVAYSSLPELLQWFRLEQEKNPEETAETLVRRREHEQYLINPKTSLNLLRVALGLPVSPFPG